MPEPFVFPFDHDWSASFQEDLDFESTFQVFGDGTEQRSALILTPQRQIGIRLKSMDQREYAAASSHIWGGLNKLWWVPYWREAVYLVADLAIGATTISIDTDLVHLVIGQGVMLWRSWNYAEVATISAVGSGTITVSALTKTWRGATRHDRIVPVFQGRMLLGHSLEYRDVDLSEADVFFRLEPGL